MAIKLVTRSGWDARRPKAVNSLPSITGIVAHYSAADADEQSDHANCAARVRGIQRYHQDTQGWNDIAYNFLVCKHGYVFEGRGFNRSGATGNANNHTVAVCFLGDDTANRDDLTPVGRLALADAFRLIEGRLGKKAWYGHRDFMSTRCPGDEIYEFVQTKVFEALVRNEKPWPVPLPKWWWAWAEWKLQGSPKGKRPKSAPAPGLQWAPGGKYYWAWIRLRFFKKARNRG